MVEMKTIISNPASVSGHFPPLRVWRFPDMFEEGGIKAGERKKNEKGGGGKTVLPSQIPKASLLKHSLPQGGGKTGRGKNRREEKKQRDSEDRNSWGQKERKGGRKE